MTRIGVAGFSVREGTKELVQRSMYVTMTQPRGRAASINKKSFMQKMLFLSV